MIVAKMSQNRPKSFQVLRDIRGEIVAARKITNRGRVQIPKEIRDALGVEDGDRIIWVRHPDGRFYILKAKTR